MGGVAFEQGGSAGRRRRAGARAILGQALAHLCLAMPGIALYLIILPRIYGFSTLGQLLDLFLMAVPFVLSVSFLAQFVSVWFKRRETAVVLFIAVSLPLFFHGRRLVAGRGDSRRDPLGEPHLSEHVGDRRARAHQPDGRKPPRRLARLDEPMDPDRDLWSACGRGGPAVHKAARSLMALKSFRRPLAILALVVGVGSAAAFVYRSVGSEPAAGADPRGRA